MSSFVALSMTPCRYHSEFRGTVGTQNLCELPSGAKMAMEHGSYFYGWIIPWQHGPELLLPWCGKRTPGAPTHLSGWHPSMLVEREYPLVNSHFAIEHDPLIVDLPSKGVIFHSYVSLPKGNGGLRLGFPLMNMYKTTSFIQMHV